MKHAQSMAKKQFLYIELGGMCKNHWALKDYRLTLGGKNADINGVGGKNITLSHFLTISNVLFCK
jgi:hypothetical protein